MPYETLKLITTITPNGEFHIITDKKDVALVSGFGSISELINKLPEQGYIKRVFRHPYQNLVLRYFLGDLEALSGISWVQNGTKFKDAIFRILRQIPPGCILTYKQVATMIGRPECYVDIMRICGSNRLSLIIPCHRITVSNNIHGSCSVGPKLKKLLIDMESNVSIKQRRSLM